MDEKVARRLSAGGAAFLSLLAHRKPARSGSEQIESDRMVRQANRSIRIVRQLAAVQVT